ncbi:MAG: hypothetical protein EXS08_07445 [Planctomycetes bacterium]|nr:hypothetical protein [Planctomycetota bacterium]
MRALPASLALLCAVTGCVSVNWTRESRYAPVASEHLARLEAGRTQLGDCLADLGAPLWVWEHTEGGQDGAALAYGWFDEEDVGVNVSVPVTDNSSASFDYTTLDARLHGLVLFFDERWVLTSFRTGWLRDLTREVRRPPTALEEDA